MLTVGLIGCHGIGRRHIEAFKKLGNAQIVAIADVVPMWAEEGAKQAGTEKWTVDYRELLEWDEIDGVSICSPNNLHAEMTVEAARHGKHVLVEKPMATTLEDADRMVSACAKAGVTLMVGQTQRFYNHHQLIKETIESGAIGKPVFVRVAFLKGFWGFDWRGWQLDGERSGGHALHNGIHFFDLTNWLIEGAPESVYAQGQKISSAALDIYDYFSIVVKYRDGRFAHLEVSAANAPRWLGYRSLKVLGTEGELKYDSESVTGASLFTETAVKPLAVGNQHAFDLEIAGWVESVETGKEPPVTPAEARLDLEMALAAEESMRNGKAVEILGGGDG